MKTATKFRSLKKLDELALEIDNITADGKVTDEEILVLREKLNALERMASEKPKH